MSEEYLQLREEWTKFHNRCSKFNIQEIYEDHLEKKFAENAIDLGHTFYKEYYYEFENQAQDSRFTREMWSIIRDHFQHNEVLSLFEGNVDLAMHKYLRRIFFFYIPETNHRYEFFDGMKSITLYDVQ